MRSVVYLTSRFVNIGKEKPREHKRRSKLYVKVLMFQCIVFQNKRLRVALNTNWFCSNPCVIFSLPNQAIIVVTWP